MFSSHLFQVNVVVQLVYVCVSSYLCMFVICKDECCWLTGTLFAKRLTYTSGLRSWSTLSCSAIVSLPFNFMEIRRVSGKYHYSSSCCAGDFQTGVISTFVAS